jgi:RNA recognition motif-containing protein
MNNDRNPLLSNLRVVQMTSGESITPVWISGVPPSWSEAYIRDLFGRYGQIHHIDLPANHSGRKAFAYIHYTTPEAADRACAEGDEMPTLHGKTLTVQLATARKTDRRRSPPRSGMPMDEPYRRPPPPPGPGWDDPRRGPPNPYDRPILPSYDRPLPPARYGFPPDNRAPMPYPPYQEHRPYGGPGYPHRPEMEDPRLQRAGPLLPQRDTRPPPPWSGGRGPTGYPAWRGY